MFMVHQQLFTYSSVWSGEKEQEHRNGWRPRGCDM